MAPTPPTPSRRDEDRFRGAVLAGTYLVVLAVLLGRILWLNDGVFAYTLDDPYIHLELARHLSQGHHGINPGEFSAPSSSILWPWLLVPWWWTGGATLAPLLYGVLASLASIAAFTRVLGRVLPDRSQRGLALGLGLAMLLAANTWAMTLSGMEHMLQIALTSWLCVGLIDVDEGAPPPRWLVPVGVLLPMCRYETLALVLLASAFLALRGHRVAGVAMGALGLGVVGAETAWLLQRTGYPLPFSVYSKGLMYQRGILGAPGFGRLLLPAVFVPVAVALGSLAAAWRLPWRGRQLPLVAVGTVLAHVAAVSAVGLFNRYMGYVTVAVALLMLWGLRQAVTLAAREGGSSARVPLWVALILAAVNLRVTWDTTLAGAHIYRMHHTLHELSTEVVQGPIAVNDIGWAALGNDHYVFDLVGLSSKESLDHLLADDGHAWMDEAAQRHGVRLVAIYRDWFGELPAAWTPVGTLVVDWSSYAPGERRVALFAPSPEAAPALRESLDAYRRTLPDGVRIVLGDG